MRDRRKRNLRGFGQTALTQVHESPTVASQQESWLLATPPRTQSVLTELQALAILESRCHEGLHILQRLL